MACAAYQQGFKPLTLYFIISMHKNKKLVFYLLATLFIAETVSAQQLEKQIPYPASPDKVIGFLEFRPKDYGKQQHPLIIFLHGWDERGDGSALQIQKVTANGIPRICAAGASMRFTYNGKTSSFVVLSPQLSRQYGLWPAWYVKEMIKYAKANLQIDTNRIYVTGISMGGGGTWAAITDSPELTSLIAAAAPVCGTQDTNDGNYANTVGAYHLPIWAFHSMDDKTVPVNCTQHAEILANIRKVTPAAKFTYYQTGGHAGAWINAYDTGHITSKLKDGSSFTAKPNLYEWFLSKNRISNGDSAVVIGVKK